MLGEGNELVRTDEASIGVFPADQRFGTDHPPGRQFDDGLIADRELVALEGARQLRGRGRPSLDHGSQGVVEQLYPAPPVPSRVRLVALALVPSGICQASPVGSADSAAILVYDM
jgi:hypothetical protein